MSEKYISPRKTSLRNLTKFNKSKKYISPSWFYQNIKYFVRALLHRICSLPATQPQSLRGMGRCDFPLLRQPKVYSPSCGVEC